MALIETSHPLRHLILPVTSSFPLNTFSLSMKLNISFKKLMWDEVLVTARLNVFVQLIVELLTQSNNESNLERNSAVPIAVGERPPTLTYVHRDAATV